jgi:cell division septation protein DedD
MPRDYSSRRGSNARPSTAKRNKRRGRSAARRTQKRTVRSGPPGCLWFVCGLCLATAAAAGVYIFARPVDSGGTQRINIDMPNGTPRKANGDDQAEHTASQANDAGQSQQKPRFSFYKLLPNYQVVIPQEKHSDHSDHSQAKASPPSAQAAPQAAAPSHTPTPTTTQNAGSGRYIIQAGAFSTYADADRRKARLALLGVTSQIVDIKLSSGKTIYRVQSQPITSSDELHQLIKRLQAHRINTLVMQAKE